MNFQILEGRKTFLSVSIWTQPKHHQKHNEAAHEILYSKIKMFIEHIGDLMNKKYILETINWSLVISFRKFGEMLTNHFDIKSLRHSVNAVYAGDIFPFLT